MALTPRILYQEAGLVVVDKPAGLPSTGRTLDDTDCVQGWLMVTLRRRRVTISQPCTQSVSSRVRPVLGSPAGLSTTTSPASW